MRPLAAVEEGVEVSITPYQHNPGAIMQMLAWIESELNAGDALIYNLKNERTCSVSEHRLFNLRLYMDALYKDDRDREFKNRRRGGDFHFQFHAFNLFLRDGEFALFSLRYTGTTDFVWWHEESQLSRTHSTPS